MTTLTINIHDLPAPLPAALEERLAKSPTKSPEELESALKAYEAKSSKLRQAHLDAVRDRAARESERLKLAKAAKLRLNASKVEKVQRKLEQAEAKTTLKKEELEARRSAQKERREAMALAVAEARQLALESRAASAEALRAREALANAKHARNVQRVQDKSAAQVKHALAVVEAHKQAAKLSAETAADRLEARLEKAALHRAHSLAETKGTHHATPEAVRHRVLNDEKVQAETRRLAFDASMVRHAANREAILHAVAEKAMAENAKAARVVELNAAKEAGTDPALAGAKSALYEKLHNAEVSRLQALRTKVDKATAAKGDTVSVIVVRRDPKTTTLRAPPPALSMRLSVVKRTLLATAAARHSGAAARRAAIKNRLAAKLAVANERRAAATARRAKAAAALEAKVTSRAARSLIHVALHTGGRLANVAKANRRHLRASAKMTAAARANDASGTAAAAKCDAAKTRRADRLRRVAKAGVVAVRRAACNSRRTSLRTAVLTRAEALDERCKAAALRRDANLAARVALARKRMVAPHPKQDQAAVDGEAPIDVSSSEA